VSIIAGHADRSPWMELAVLCKQALHAGSATAELHFSGGDEI